MTLMDGKVGPVEQISQAQFSHVRMWGVINLDTGNAEVRTSCRHCGSSGAFLTKGEALQFRTDHRGENNVCPYAKNIIY